MLTQREHDKLQQYIQGIDVTRMTAAFNALGEPNRCLIFRALLRGHTVGVGDLASIIGISASLASQHLKTLLQAGLVERTKAGKSVYYHVNDLDPQVKALLKAVED